MKIFIVAVLVSLIAVCNSQTTAQIQCVSNAVDTNSNIAIAVARDCANFNIQVRSSLYLECAKQFSWGFPFYTLESYGFPAAAVQKQELCLRCNYRTSFQCLWLQFRQL